jgi:hypothetical protein
VLLLLVLPSLPTSVRINVLPEPILPRNHSFAPCAPRIFWILQGISQLILFSIRLECSLGNCFYGLLWPLAVYFGQRYMPQSLGPSFRHEHNTSSGNALASSRSQVLYLCQSNPALSSPILVLRACSHLALECDDILSSRHFI